jgi:hypothetical protein
MSHACRACQGRTSPFADTLVLGSVEASFEQCATCGMVMAVEPTWLDRAYESAITRLDVGLLDRCLLLSQVTASVLRSERLRDGRFLDWAGGYGTLTRMMRDRGYNFTHLDHFATNVFAEGHDRKDLDGERYDLVTMFEVLEHLERPAEALAEVAASTDRLLATTQVLPDPAPKPEDWWYYTLETGQHITLYTPGALQALAERLAFDGVVVGRFVHLFYRGRLSPSTRFLVRHAGLAYASGTLASVLDRRRSLLAEDLELARRSSHGQGS